MGNIKVSAKKGHKWVRDRDRKGETLSERERERDIYMVEQQMKFN